MKAREDRSEWTVREPERRERDHKTERDGEEVTS